MKSRYTPVENRRLLQAWIGEDLFAGFLAEVNKEKAFGIFITPPTDFDKPNRDQIFVEQIRLLSESGRLLIHPTAVSDDLKGMTIVDAEGG